VTAFDEGDFLSTHNDGSSGSAAWVLHLSKGWDKSRGGELRFDSSINQPTDFAPAFNRMSLFLTRVGVLCDAKPAPMSSRKICDVSAHAPLCAVNRLPTAHLMTMCGMRCYLCDQHPPDGDCK
jgi:hypothetical protein